MCVYEVSQGVLPLSNSIIKINFIKREVCQISVNSYACITKSLDKRKKSNGEGETCLSYSQTGSKQGFKSRMINDG